MKQNETKKLPKNAEQYICVICNFKCSKKSNYDTHISTRKHINATNETSMKRVDAKPFTESCQHCGIIFNSRTTLWRHKKKCTFDTNKGNEEAELLLNHYVGNEENYKDMFIEVMKKHSEITEIMMEQQKTIQELVPKVGNTTNTTTPTPTTAATPDATGPNTTGVPVDMSVMSGKDLNNDFNAAAAVNSNPSSGGARRKRSGTKKRRRRSSKKWWFF